MKYCNKCIKRTINNADYIPVQLRTEKGFSQEELAEKCELHPTYIGQVERGEKNATIESIYKITAGLSVSMSTLFDKIDHSDSINNKNNYPFIAYDLVQSLPDNSQKKIILILQSIIDMI